MSETTSTVPPFIPGLIIVGLLIVISIAIGYRNYTQRMNHQLPPRIGDWAFWDLEGVGEGGGREQPKLWEVGIGARESREKDAEWRQIMPLSAISFTADPSIHKVTSETVSPPHSTTGSPIPSSGIARLVQRAHPPRQPETLPSSPPCRLQVCVMISMPSSHHPQCQQHQPNHDVTIRNSPDDSTERSPSHTGFEPKTTQSVLWDEKRASDLEEIEISPEVVLGVTVLPWRKETGDSSSESEAVPVPS